MTTPRDAIAGKTVHWFVVHPNGQPAPCGEGRLALLVPSRNAGQTRRNQMEAVSMTDAIGLSERLRERADTRNTLTRVPDNDSATMGYYDAGAATLDRKAATQLDALQERVKKMTSLLAISEDLRRRVIDVAEQWQARATRAEQERDKLQGMLLLCGELGGIGNDETPVAYLRRLIDGLINASRERDEAVALLVRVNALAQTSAWRRMPDGGSFGRTSLASDIDAAIRRLASGPDKEKRE